jgi:hypothetical protein
VVFRADGTAAHGLDIADPSTPRYVTKVDVIDPAGAEQHFPADPDATQFTAEVTVAITYCKVRGTNDACKSGAAGQLETVTFQTTRATGKLNVSSDQTHLDVSERMLLNLRKHPHDKKINTITVTDSNGHIYGPVNCLNGSDDAGTCSMVMHFCTPTAPPTACAIVR